MSTFPIIFASELNCISSPIISIMAWRKLEYELAFAYIWGFSLVEEDPIFPGAFGPRIGEGFNNIFECLTDFYNVEINRHFNIEPEESYSLIKESISKNMPVIIFTDMYNCIWSAMYKKAHVPHSCTVIDLDNEGNPYCIDAAPTCNGASMEIHDFNESCTGCLTINLDKYNNDGINWQNVLHNAVSRMYENGTFSSLSEFVDRFEKDFDVEAEVKTARGHSPQTSHIVWKLLRISGGRKLFSIYLNHLGIRYQNKDLIYLSKEIESISDKWKINQALLLRHLHAPEKKDISHRISENFYALYELEKRTAASIYKL